MAGRTVFLDKDGTGAPDANNPSTITDANGNFTFSGLAPGSYTVKEVLPAGVTLSTPLRTVTVAADQTASGVTFGETTITGKGVTFAATETQAFTGTVATFTDPQTTDTAAQFSASINWGDGVASVGTVTGSAGSFTVLGVHTYAEDGALPVQVTLSSTGTSTATSTAASTADVMSAGLTVSAVSVSAIEGQSFSGTIATFTDAASTDAATQFSAVINWGDGTSSTGTVGGSSGTFTVAAMHTYADEGGFTISVNVVDTQSVPPFTASATASATVAESDVPNGGMVGFSATAGVTFNGGVANFSDSNAQASASDFTAKINWGDGSSSTGTVVGAKNFIVSGSHDYAAAGSFSVTVTVADDAPGTSTVPIIGTVQVAPLPPLNAQFVAAAYVDLLARPVDPPSLAAATDELDRGVGRGVLVNLIDHSAEYFARIIVTPAFERFLGRAPDAAGLAYWVDQLQNHGLTDEQLEAGFIGSTEYYQHSGGTDALWVDAMYLDLLGRAPEPQGEAYWVGRLAAGVSRTEVAYVVAASLERERERITDDYMHYLGRLPDVQGLDNWVNLFAQGVTNENLITGLVASDEYFARHTT